MKIAIVGAGMTGLTAARELTRRGHEVTVYERKDEPGGSVKSVQENGWMMEYGPNTIQVRSRQVLDLLESLDLDMEICRADEAAAKRYIVHDGVLKPLPGSVGDFIKSDLFPTSAKWGLFGDLIAKKGTDPSETLSSFVRRRLGQPWLDYAINPFVAGIYAGDPVQLSVRYAFPRLYELEQQYGSLILGSLLSRRKRKKAGRIPPQMLSFQKGLQTLPRALAAGAGSLEYGATVERVQQKEGRWILTVNGSLSEPYDRVLLTIPLYHQSEQLVNGGGQLLQAADQLIYPPLSVILTGYRTEQVNHPLDGFGFLVPEVEKRTILGTLFSSSLFPGRAPEGHVLLTTFVGGARSPGRAGKESGVLREEVSKELSDLLGIIGEPAFFDHVYWPKSIPNYTTAYPEVLKAIEQVESQNTGVYLGGNYRGGISLPDCMESGLAWADRLTEG